MEILALLAAIFTALLGFKQFLIERDVKSYQENVKNLFSQDKEILLSAIATLGYYKDKKRYRNDVIDILINRLYTELDYDVTNAIIAELSQVSTNNELNKISQKLLDINRSFVIQSTPLKSRKEVVARIHQRLKVEYIEQLEKTKDLDDDIIQQQNEYLNEKRQEYLHYDDLLEYRLFWHKQIVSHAIAILLLEANRQGLTKAHKLRFYSNSFCYCQIFDITLMVCSIKYTDFMHTRLQEVKSPKTEISTSYFESALLRECRFEEGKISHVEFINTKLDGVDFGKVEFEEVYFIGVEMNNCKFDNTNGLDPLLFYNCTIANCSFSEGFDTRKIKSVTKEALMTKLRESERSLFTQELITKAVESQKNLNKPN